MDLARVPVNIGEPSGPIRAIRTPESRFLAASVSQMPLQVVLPIEAAAAIRAQKLAFLRQLAHFAQSNI